MNKEPVFLPRGKRTLFLIVFAIVFGLLMNAWVRPITDWLVTAAVAFVGL